MGTFGRYVLLERLASGGMAEVWRAEVSGPAGVRKEVALKLVRGEHAADGELARMFVEEARLAARLSHANVVQVFELCEEGGRHALAMELVRGRDLGRVLERCRERGLRLGLPRAVHVGVEVARGLAYAHRLSEGGRPVGLVHRDVSPHNILLSFEGEVKLADFGIARAMSRAGLTDPGTVKGKLAYMAPEQARGEPLDARADVFSLGVVLWELCAGRRLFARDGDAATLAALLGDEPVSPPSAWNEAVPAALDEAILGALRRDPARRTASAEALGASLAAVLMGLARAPEDVDLRGFMRRLWPDEAEGRGAPGPTAVRGGGPGAGASATRTLSGARDGRRLVPRAALAAALAAAAVLAWRLAGPAGGGGPEVGAGESGSPVRSRPAEAGGDADRAGAPAEQLALEPGVDAGDAARGEGRVVVTVHPWASVAVDGRPVGETPQDLRLPAGPHRLRATHPTLGSAEVELVVEAGRRLTWRPALAR